jgi:hypothetical protein
VRANPAKKKQRYLTAEQAGGKKIGIGVAANVEKQSGWQANVHFEVRDDVSEHGRRIGFPQAR